MINGIRISSILPGGSSTSLGFVGDKTTRRPVYNVRLSDGERYLDGAAWATKTAAYTIDASEMGKFFGHDSTTGFTFTLPKASTVPAGTVHFVVVQTASSGTHSITPNAADTIVGMSTSLAAGAPLTLTGFVAGDTLSVTSNGTATWTITDNTKAIVAPGTLTLAEGSVIVGNSSGVGTALAAKTSGRILVGNGTTVTSVAVSGDATLSSAGALTLAVPKVKVLTETIAAADLTDGGAAVGTKSFTGTVPKGAILLGSKVLVTAGFAGDVSATLTIGDGTDADRFMTGTPSVFATAADGIETGVPSGDKLATAVLTPVVTITSDSDITPVLAGGGSLVASLYYLQTV